MSFLSQLTIRQTLGLDAAASGGLGLMLLAGGGLLEGWLGIATPLLQATGAALILWAAAVGWLASRPSPSRGAVWTVIALNAVWAIESALALATGWIAPTSLGVAFILAQAAAVAMFAELQVMAVRRPVPALA